MPQRGLEPRTRRLPTVLLLIRLSLALDRRGLSVYTTLAPPQHTVVPRGGATAESLADVEYLVFTELVWAGKATMTHTCLVEHAWLEQLLPLVEQAGRLPTAAHCTVHTPCTHMT
jgi:hypothetical protein